MTQKKFFQIAGIIVASVWVFCATFAIALTVERNSDRNIPLTNPPATTTTSPQQNQQGIFATTPTSSVTPVSTTQAPVTDSPSIAVTEPSSQSQTTASQSTNAPQGKDAIVAAYINGVNTLKSTSDFKMSKNDTLNITIDKITGGTLVQQFAESLIAPPAPESYTFVGGVDSATGETPNSTVAPLNTSAAVDINAVTNAVCQPNQDGGYTIQLTIAEETQTQDQPTKNLSTMVEVVDVQGLLPSGAKITEMTINYSPSTITATFDSQNRIVSMQHHLISQGGGSGGMSFVNVTMQMHGEYTSDYSITYN